MKREKMIYPKVVAGGTAVPLGKNFYYMTGKKHKDGGIDVGKNPKTGLEVEDGEVMHLTNKEVKVFSAVPFLNGESPAKKVMGGDNATKVFNAQQKYKRDNNINDDGSKKELGGKTMVNKKYAVGGKKKILPTLPNRGVKAGIYTDQESNAAKLADEVNASTDMSNITIDPLQPAPSRFNRVMSDVGNVLQKGVESVDNFYSERPGALGDTIGVGANIIGGLISNRANNKMLDKLQYAKSPYARQATKLKTTININPQIDKMRESLADYERDIDSGTASSRVALARKQRGRVANMLQTNELYGNKENLETELINKDKLNQQQVADANTTDYNRWQEGKAAFDNAVREKRSENTVSLVETLNAGVQDVITRGEKRNATRENMLTIAASHPNVNPRILKELGVKSITDKMVDDWDKANIKKGKKSNSKTK